MTISVIVCAFNEARLLSACLYSLRAQTHPPDEILVVNNASTDATADEARAVSGVRVIDEPTKGLVLAREAGRRAATSDVLAYVDADCRAPVVWLERLSARFERGSAPIAVTGPYRFYDRDASGRALIGLYDFIVAPATHAFVHHALGLGAILYGGNFAVRADALTAIGGFDRSIEFHGEVPIWAGASLALDASTSGTTAGSGRRRAGQSDGKTGGLQSVRPQLLVRDPAPPPG